MAFIDKVPIIYNLLLLVAMQSERRKSAIWTVLQDQKPMHVSPLFEKILKILIREDSKNINLRIEKFLGILRVLCGETHLHI